MGYEKHRIEANEEVWRRAARLNDYRCAYGHLIEYCDREFYFREGLCGLCYCALFERQKADAFTCA